MKVMLALSGGVDSAVCARLLQQQGHTVHGVVIRFSPAHEGAVLAALRAARELSIPLAVADCTALFEEEIIAPFCAAYAAGRTPSPCVLCNPLVKFKVLAQQAGLHGAEAIATGHYARVARDGEFYRVLVAHSQKRDQSYMLYRLPQSMLSRLLLPLGELDKPGVRTLAAQYGLSSAAAPDSQEICFIPGGNYAAWLAARGVRGAQGRFIAPGGEALGPHRGVLHYTVGQRRGLGLALGRPVYVKAILPGGDVRLGWAGDIGATGLTLRDVAALEPLNGEYMVKIRSVATPVPCTVTTQNGVCGLRFATPQRAPAPGQHAVLYRGEWVMGGGEIDTVTDE